jgi:hypothetical protein
MLTGTFSDLRTVLVRLAVFPACSIYAIHSVGVFLPRDWMTDIGIIDRALEYHASLVLLSLSFSHWAASQFHLLHVIGFCLEKGVS